MLLETVFMVGCFGLLGLGLTGLSLTIILDNLLTPPTLRFDRRYDAIYRQHRHFWQRTGTEEKIASFHKIKKARIVYPRNDSKYIPTKRLENVRKYASISLVLCLSDFTFSNTESLHPLILTVWNGLTFDKKKFEQFREQINLFLKSDSPELVIHYFSPLSLFIDKNVVFMIAVIGLCLLYATFGILRDIPWMDL